MLHITYVEELVKESRRRKTLNSNLLNCAKEIDLVLHPAHVGGIHILYYLWKVCLSHFNSINRDLFCFFFLFQVISKFKTKQGPVLQKLLEDRAKRKDNWVRDFHCLYLYRVGYFISIEGNTQNFHCTFYKALGQMTDTHFPDNVYIYHLYIYIYIYMYVEKIWNIMNNSNTRLWGSMHFAYIKSIFRNFLLNEKMKTLI